MKNEHEIKGQNNLVKELHRETQQWKTHFQIIEDELFFIERLLDSSAFKTNTPNLFERLQKYKLHVKQLQKRKKEVRELISQHEHILGESLGETNDEHNLEYFSRHMDLKIQVNTYFADFQQQKLEIFNYAGGILQKN